MESKVKLLFTLFEESPLYTNAIFDEKAHKKIFLLFCLKKKYKHNSIVNGFLKSHVFEIRSLKRPSKADLT